MMVATGMALVPLYFPLKVTSLGLEKSNLCAGTTPNFLLPSTLLWEETCEV